MRLKGKASTCRTYWTRKRLHMQKV